MLEQKNSGISSDSDSEYLEKHYIQIYLSDALHMSTLTPLDAREQAIFMHSYFENVKLGNHVKGRDWRYIRSTPWNLACFTKEIKLALSDSSYGEEEIGMMCELVCPDCDLSIIHDVFNIALKVTKTNCEQRKVAGAKFCRVLAVYLANIEIFEKIQTLLPPVNHEDVEKVAKYILDVVSEYRGEAALKLEEIQIILRGDITKIMEWIWIRLE